MSRSQSALPIGLVGTMLTMTLLATTANAGEVSMGLYQHDIMDGISKGPRYERGNDVVFGVRTAAPEKLSMIWSPHVHMIVGLNTRGGTNYAAAGLNWRFKFGHDQQFYIQPGIGLGVHTGSVNLPSPFDPGLTPAEASYRLNRWQTKLDLGSRLLLEPELSLGWKATDRWAVEASWIHFSHAQLADSHNPGLGNFGFRAVYNYGVDK